MTDKQVLDLMRYIDDNDCTSVNMFVACLLVDVRAGRHIDWYNRFFSDSVFREYVAKFCTVCVFGYLCVEIRELEEAIDDYDE